VTGRLAVRIGDVELANPIVCGAGEHLIEAGGVHAAIAAGAGAVVVKSANESEAARRQLDHTDYALLGDGFDRLEWNGDAPIGASLLNRSGLYPGTLDDWIEMTASLVASAGDTVVIPSVIPGDPKHAPSLCRRVATETGCAVLELNTGAPHGREASSGAITLVTESDRLTALVGSVRDEVDVPVWLKLTSQTDDVAALAAAAFDAGADAVTLMGRHMALLPDLESQAPVLGTFAAYGGQWALPLTCRWLALTRAAVGPDRPLLATNGARTGLDVARFLLAGASAVQMNTAIFTGGFDAIRRAITELDDYLTTRGDTAESIVGRAADRITAYTDQPADPSAWHRFIPEESKPRSER